MTDRRDDPEIARLKKRLADAEAELAAAKRRGVESEPMWRRALAHAKENRVAERVAASLRDTRRHA